MSDTVAELITLIASMLVAMMVVSAAISVAFGYSDTITQQAESESQDIRTDISIVSDVGTNAIYDSDNTTVTLLIKNTGTTTISPNQTNIYIDGQYYQPNSTERLGPKQGGWREGTVIRATIDATLTPGQHVIEAHVESSQDEIVVYI